MARRKKRRRVTTPAPPAPQQVHLSTRPFAVLTHLSLAKKAPTDTRHSKAQTHRDPTRHHAATDLRVPAPQPPVSQKAGSSTQDDPAIAALAQAYHGVAPMPQQLRLRMPAQRRVITQATPTPATSAPAALQVERGEGLDFSLRRRDSDPRRLRALRQGKLPPVASLDLHGMTKAEAQPAVSRFVRKQQQRGASVVAIVTGRGAHSQGGIAVLRELVIDLCTTTLRCHLVCACAAPPHLGGTGVLLLCLRRC